MAGANRKIDLPSSTITPTILEGGRNDRHPRNEIERYEIARSKTAPPADAATWAKSKASRRARHQVHVAVVHSRLPSRRQARTRRYHRRRRRQHLLGLRRRHR